MMIVPEYAEADQILWDKVNDASFHVPNSVVCNGDCKFKSVLIKC